MSPRAKQKIKPRPKPKGKRQTKNAEPKKSAPKEKADRRPQDWDIVVAAAYLRLLGASQEQSAKGAGCARRSIQMWEKKSWWKDALDEARGRWLKDSDAAAMRAHLAIFNDKDERAAHTRWTMERRFSEFKPPKIRGEFGGPDGAPMVMMTEVVFVDPDDKG